MMDVAYLKDFFVYIEIFWFHKLYEVQLCHTVNND